jgi:L-threonylcarbamoyladenylate synthase
VQKKLTLKKDGIAVIMTDTIYGLVGSAFSRKAVARIGAAKGRDDHKPYIVLISSTKDLELFGVVPTLSQKLFLKKAWPGKVSVIFPVPSKKFEHIHRGKKEIAFRLPKLPKIKKGLVQLATLIKQTGPLIAPSANPQGLVPATTIAEAKNYFGDKVDVYIAANKKDFPKVGKPSTLVRFNGDTVEILREGAVKIPKHFLKK